MSNDKSKKDWTFTVGLVAGGALLLGGAVAYRMYAADVKKKKKKKKIQTAAKSSTPTPSPNTTTAAAPTATPPAAAAAAAPTVVPSNPTDSGDLSREDLVSMFKDIVAGMDALIFKLARTEHDLRKQKADKQQLLATLSMAYQQDMQRLQVQAFEKYKTTEQAAEKAVAKYQNDPEFVAVRKRMDLINNALMGGVPPPDQAQLANQPSWLTVDKVIEIFSAMMTAMTESMVEAVNEVSAEHGDGPPPNELVNKRYLEKITVVKDSVLAKYELDEKMLDVAMLKYANDQKLANVMIELQTEQEAKFQALQQRVWGSGN